MTKASPMQTSFNAGEFSPLMKGHINLERFKDSAVLIQNLIPLKQGPVIRRGGFKFVKEVKDSGDDTIILPFEFSVTQSYLIEAGDLYFRFVKDGGMITEASQSITGATQANPVVVTYSGADNYANNDEVYIDGVVGMTELNGRFFRVANVNTGSNTFELQDLSGNNIDGTGYTAYTSDGTIAEIYEVTSPYPTGDLVDSTSGSYKVYTLQSADTLFICHGDYAVRSLVRSGDTNWAVNQMTFNDGPYLPINAEDTTLTLSGTTGSVTVTASATTGINGGQGFLTTDVDRLIRWRDPANNWTWLKITSRTNSTTVNADIMGADASATTATTEWRLGTFSDTTGHPKVITIYQDRIVLLGCDDYPDRYEFSKTGGYSTTDFQFAPSDADGTVTDDAGFGGNLSDEGVNTIQWAAPDEDGVVVGGATREFIIRSNDSTANGITPSNQSNDKLSKTGSYYAKPVEGEDRLVFIQRARRKIHDIGYNFEADKLKPRDLTVASEHITKTGVAQLAYQQEPNNTIWQRRTDGLLIGLTYYPDEAVFGMHRHSIGGTDAQVKAMAVISADDETSDVLYCVIERTINSVTKKYIEYMTPYYATDGSMDKEDYIAMDSALTYDNPSTAVTQLTNLHHLEGETVQVLVDGNTHPDLTVSGGAVTLANSLSGNTIQIGLGNTWALQTQPQEAGARLGVSQGRNKRIAGIYVRLLNSLGMKYGPSSAADDLDEYDFDQGGYIDTSTGLFSGITEYLEYPGDYEQEGEIYLTHDGPMPICIQAIAPDLTTYEDQ